MRNKIQTGDQVEILPAKGKIESSAIEGITDESGQLTSVAQPGQIVTLAMAASCSKMDLIRRIN